MPILEQILSIVAPHDCLVCGLEGNLLCADCRLAAVCFLPARCYKCSALSQPGQSWRTCIKCRPSSALQFVYVRSQYSGAAKELLHALKFERAYAAAKIVADLAGEVFRAHDLDCVVPIPTATVRRRQRGYDQAELIARHLGKSHDVKLVSALSRRGDTRQVGTKRAERLAQLKDAFYVPYAHQIKGKSVLLVDDVLTTGATLEAAAKVLRQAGAKHVSAIVFAQA